MYVGCYSESPNLLHIQANASMSSLPSSPKPHRMVLVGLGRRSLSTALHNIHRSPFFTLVAVCDPDVSLSGLVRDLHPRVSFFPSVDSLLEHQKGMTNERITCAYVSIPHSKYLQVVPTLLQEGIHVLKEKPAGTISAELEMFQDLARLNEARLVTASQSRYGTRLGQLSQWVPLIGKMLLIEGTRKISVPDLGQGWRASKQLAGGGAVNDLGWHLIDNILGLLDPNCDIAARYSKLLKTRSSPGYDCEDSALVTLEIHEPGVDQPVIGQLAISRNGLEKMDELTVTGSLGVIVAHKDCVEISIREGPRPQQKQISTPSDQDFDHMLRYFHNEISREAPSEKYLAFGRQDRQVTELVDTLYAIDEKNTSNDRLSRAAIVNSASKVREASLFGSLQWPRVTQDMAREVMAQISKTISISDNLGVFGEFEKEFKQFHGHPDWHALLHNSGTNALQGLYYACQFVPGDEVRDRQSGWNLDWLVLANAGSRSFFRCTLSLQLVPQQCILAYVQSFATQGPTATYHQSQSRLPLPNGQRLLWSVICGAGLAT